MGCVNPACLVLRCAWTFWLVLNFLLTAGNSLDLRQIYGGTTEIYWCCLQQYYMPQQRSNVIILLAKSFWQFFIPLLPNDMFNFLQFNPLVLAPVPIMSHHNWGTLISYLTMSRNWFNPVHPIKKYSKTSQGALAHQLFRRLQPDHLRIKHHPSWQHNKKYNFFLPVNYATEQPLPNTICWLYRVILQPNIPQTYPFLPITSTEAINTFKAHFFLGWPSVKCLVIVLVSSLLVGMWHVLLAIRFLRYILHFRIVKHFLTFRFLNKRWINKFVCNGGKKLGWVFLVHCGLLVTKVHVLKCIRWHQSSSQMKGKNCL